MRERFTPDELALIRRAIQLTFTAKYRSMSWRQLCR